MRDEFITEAMGECWHVWQTNESFHNVWFKCNKCGIVRTPGEPNNNDFSTWAGFGKLWEWAKEQKWWKDFCHSTGCHTAPMDPETIYLNNDLTDPKYLADCICEYLKENNI